jgi:hypothetical protein
VRLKEPISPQAVGLAVADTVDDTFEEIEYRADEVCVLEVLDKASDLEELPSEAAETDVMLDVTPDFGSDVSVDKFHFNVAYMEDLW